MVIVLITFFDRNKIRSAFTEHPKQNNKFLTPGLGGPFIPAKVAKGIGFFEGLEAIDPDHLKWEVIDHTQPDAEM